MDQNKSSLEVWLRGPLPGFPPHLQPVAHALLQAREEVTALLIDFPDELLWERQAELASPGFHLQHLTGVLDRLFTYARNEALTETQRKYLLLEGQPEFEVSVPALLHAFAVQVDKALVQLKETDEATLLETRGVGRAQIPSTVIGLFIHAAEHTTRHVGQLLVTVRILKNI